MFFLKKQPDTINLLKGTVTVNNFLLDGWTTDEVFLRVFGDNATPSKKQATYVLQDVQARMNDIEFNNALVQFSPLGSRNQRVTKNITLYAQPCKYADFTKRVLSNLPKVKPSILTEYDLVAIANGMCFTAHFDAATAMAYLNIEYLDYQSRIDNWVKEGREEMVTPKSGALQLLGKVYHANLRENTFKSDLLPLLTVPERCEMNENAIVYTFRDLSFYDITGDISFSFIEGKLSSLKIISKDEEDMVGWLRKNIGKPVEEEEDYICFRTNASGAREWYIRASKEKPSMDWFLKVNKYT